MAGAFSYGATLDNEPPRRALERPPPAAEGTLRPFHRFAPPLLLLGGSTDASLSAGGPVSGDNDQLECLSGLRRLLWQGVEGRSGDGDDDANDSQSADEAQGGTTGGAVLAVLQGGSFGTPCWPLDPFAAACDPDFALDPSTSGAEAEAAQAALRDTLAELLLHWLDARVAPPGWLPWPEEGDGAEGGESAGGARERDASIAATADGLGMPLYSSRAERAMCWPPEPEEYALVCELK